MAEFVEVMKHRKRMCDALKPGCGSCGLCSDNNNCNVSCNGNGHANYANVSNACGVRPVFMLKNL